MRVLVVDDSPIQQAVLRALLRALGHEAETFGDGAAAVTRAAEVPFDLVLMDLTMPGMDGLTATLAIRAGPTPPPVVILTGRDGPTLEGAARAAGAEGLLTKPLDLTQLGAVLARYSAASGSAGSA